MFNIVRDKGMRIVIDLGRPPDDPGKRADVEYALRVLADNGMVEWLEWPGEDDDPHPRR